MGWLLLVYLVGLLVIGAVGGAGLYHARKYRYKGDATHFWTAVYLVSMTIILVVSIAMIIGTDWSRSSV